MIASLHDGEIAPREMNNYEPRYDYASDKVRAGLRGLKDALGAPVVARLQSNGTGASQLDLLDCESYRADCALGLAMIGILYQSPRRFLTGLHQSSLSMLRLVEGSPENCK